MKPSRLIMVVATLVLFAGSLTAQPGYGHNRGKGDFAGGNRSSIPDLSDDQKAKINELRLAHYKETQPLRNQLGELKARQKTLTTAEKADMKAINSNIDEITKIQNQLMKKSVAMHQQMRALLTDEQKVWLDSRQGSREMHRGMGRKQGSFRSQGAALKS